MKKYIFIIIVFAALTSCAKWVPAPSGMHFYHKKHGPAIKRAQAMSDSILSTINKKIYDKTKDSTDRNKETGQ